MAGSYFLLQKCSVLQVRKICDKWVRFHFSVDYSTVLCCNMLRFEGGGEEMKLEQKINLVTAVIQLITALILLYKASEK